MPSTIEVLVRAQAKHEKVEKIDEKTYRVHVKAPPTDGKANEDVLKVLAKYLGCAQSELEIIHGSKSKKKLIKLFI